MRFAGTIAAFVVVTLCASSISLAADTHAPAASAPGHATTADAAHPAPANQAVLPPPGIRWPGVMMIIVLGMFLAALIVGPVVRINMPEEVPVSHAHDESHGHDPDHGHGHARKRPLHPGDSHDRGHGGHH